MQEGLKKAVGVPLGLAERVTLLWPSLKDMVLHGNVACKSDAQVSVRTSQCGPTEMEEVQKNSCQQSTRVNAVRTLQTYQELKQSFKNLNVRTE